MEAHPVKHRQTRLFTNGSPDGRYIATVHTFATLAPKSHKSPPLDGIAVDVSSMQYENALQSMTITEYNRTRVQTGTSTAYPFGYNIFRDHYSRLLRDEHWDVGAMKLEAGIRVTNNVVYTWATTFGERQNLKVISHDSFIYAKNKLRQQLDEAMQELREQVDIAIVSFDPGAKLYGVVQKKAGVGHLVMMGMLETRLYQDNSRAGLWRSSFQAPT